MRPLLTMTRYSIYCFIEKSVSREESAALGHFSVSIFFGQVDNEDSKNKYSSIAVYFFSAIVHFFVAQGTLFSGCIGPRFSTDLSMIKTVKMKDFSTQCYSNL